MPVQFNRGITQPYATLELLAKQAVEGFITGLHKSPFHGFSVEFAEHRAYNPGESTRHLDWKLLARTDKHFTKRYEEETNLRCQLVVDVSSSMLFPGKVNPAKLDEWNKLKFALYGAASVMELLLKQRDAVGLSLFNEQLLLHTKASSSQAHVRYLYSELEQQLEQSGSSFSASTHVADVLHEIAERTHKRSMVVIFSDMLDDQRHVDEIFNALQHLRHNKHEVLLFQVVHENQEVEFNFENRPTTFVDLESGQEIKLHPHEVRKTYIEKMEAFKSDLKLKAGQIGVDYFEANMQSGVQQVLLQFLLKRQRMNA